MEAEQRASLEAPAKAEKARTIVEAEAAAERRQIEARAEAAAIYARLEAEARGQYEILAKKGEGRPAFVEACGGADQAYKLLMLERVETLAQTAATAISNIKFDKVVVWDGGSSAGPGGAAGFVQSMGRSLPPMMQVLRDLAGVELPDFVGRMSPEALPMAAVPDDVSRNAGDGTSDGANGTATTERIAAADAVNAPTMSPIGTFGARVATTPTAP